MLYKKTILKCLSKHIDHFYNLVICTKHSTFTTKDFIKKFKFYRYS